MKYTIMGNKSKTFPSTKTSLLTFVNRQRQW